MEPRGCRRGAWLKLHGAHREKQKCGLVRVFPFTVANALSVKRGISLRGPPRDDRGVWLKAGRRRPAATPSLEQKPAKNSGETARKQAGNKPERAAEERGAPEI
jgi:hypothetical protein